ncbi:hypothetical protein P4E94_18675 [Pontiellaceae bacterium B12219]|nr:hypothetical protein [Pontiellaceae bacterium B12219]
MENELLPELIAESIRLELNAAELYRLFSRAYTEHSDFWWQLHLEEKSHASLIRVAGDSFTKRGQFPHAMIPGSLKGLQHSNQKIKHLIDRVKTNPPPQHEACHLAIELENESGELHFTQFMEKETDSSLETVFRQLNRGDKAHEERIRAHRKSI